MEIPQQSN